jgi:hypothetical protein
LAASACPSSALGPFSVCQKTSRGRERKQPFAVMGFGREITVMFENGRKRDFVWMALGFIVAGGLTAWVTALSIERLLYADLDSNSPPDKWTVNQATQQRPDGRPGI